MNNATLSNKLTWADVYNALAGTADDPLAIARAAEEKADEIETAVANWCVEKYAESSPVLLRECADVIKTYGDYGTPHRAIMLTDRTTGADAICVLYFDDAGALHSRRYKCTPNEITGYILVADPEHIVDGNPQLVYPVGVHIYHDPSENEKRISEDIRDACERPIYAANEETEASRLMSYILGWLKDNENITYAFSTDYDCDDFDFEVTHISTRARCRDEKIDPELEKTYDEYMVKRVQSDSYEAAAMHRDIDVKEHDGIYYLADYESDPQSFQGPEDIDAFKAWKDENYEQILRLITIRQKNNEL
jgi:hypothetical protein